MTNVLDLEFESVFSIKRKEEGLSEPSGLAMAPDGCLWTVCDESRRLFCIDPEGRLLSTLEIDNRGLEGITFDAEGRVWVVDEDVSKIIGYDRLTGTPITDRRLKDIEGYSAIAKHFEDAANKGLEGITFDSLRSEFLLLKEAKPGLLIAISSNLERIVAVTRLNERNGFTADKVKSKKLDFSGMCYDAVHDLLWIVSDEAKRVYTFDRNQKCVIQSFALKNGPSGRKIRKAEGVALDPESKRLYVVSDQDAALYVFRIVSQ
ncbi:MAG: SdiA-regulated domain-containing protein [Planctomycetes bacterium]|nr:SdiA-regulated domain-containing protein [Planctomycetota bacterium]MCH9724147.1 SdiA-regulated domain-containing protein [Planctomycetota bacterium]